MAELCHNSGAHKSAVIELQNRCTTTVLIRRSAVSLGVLPFRVNANNADHARGIGLGWHKRWHSLFTVCSTIPRLTDQRIGGVNG